MVTTFFQIIKIVVVVEVTSSRQLHCSAICTVYVCNWSKSCYTNAKDLFMNLNILWATKSTKDFGKIIP